MAKHHCGFEGCNAPARRGTARCAGHAEPGAAEGNQNARKHGLYAAYVPVVELKNALRLPPGDLRLEIAVVRQVLQELLQSELAPVDLMEAVDKATSALVRMLKTNKQLSEDAAGELETAVEQYLRELGLGGGG